MRFSLNSMPALAGSAIGLVLAAGFSAAPASAAAKRIQVSHSMGATTMQAPSTIVTISKSRGQLVNLAAPISDVFVADEKVADVQVRSPTQIYIFGKDIGETTIYATSKAGAVVYATNVRVASNPETVGQMLKLAMPEADIQTTTMNGVILLTGTVRNPDDAAEAERLVQAYVGDTTKVISRLRTATPLQVNLQVRIAEVSRDLVKEIGVNLLSRDTTGGFQFGIAQGRNFGSIGPFDYSKFPTRDFSTQFGFPAGTIPNLPFNPAMPNVPLNPTSGTAFNLNGLGQGAGKTSLAFLGKLFGLDVASALDLAETDGFVTTLANPNLTALSGETASFLAGGEIPIPISQGLGQVSIEYKQYGVSLAFTPVVLADGRISMRVRPEVSDLTNTGAVTLNGFSVPALTTRRAETTVELGSGQSFMIGGLLSNKNLSTINKAPGAGDLPIIGALFRSSKFQRSETELVIIVTPYLVKPSSTPLALPTDGYKAATDFNRVFLGQAFQGTSEPRPTPTMAPPQAAPVPPPAGGGAVALAAPARPDKRADNKGAASAAPAPGFTLK